MSEQTMTEQTPNVDATPKAKRTRKQVIEHSAAIAAYAKAKNISADKAGKQFRARLRANSEAYVKNGGKQHTKNTPWSAHPRKALAAIFPDVTAFKA